MGLRKIKLSFMNAQQKVDGVKETFLTIKGENFFARRIIAKVRVEQIYESSPIDAIVDTGACYSIIPYEFWSKSEYTRLVEDSDPILLRKAAREFGVTKINGIGTTKTILCYFAKIKIAFQTQHSDYRWLQLPAKLIKEGHLPDCKDIILGLADLLDIYKMHLYGVYETGADKGLSYLEVPDNAFVNYSIK